MSRPNVLFFDRKCKGSGEYKKWEICLEKFFELKELSGYEKFRFARSKLIKKANTWLGEIQDQRKKEKKKKIQSWDKLRKHMRRKYHVEEITKEEVCVNNLITTFFPYKEQISLVEEINNMSKGELEKEVSNGDMELATRVNNSCFMDKEEYIKQIPNLDFEKKNSFENQIFENINNPILEKTGERGDQNFWPENCVWKDSIHHNHKGEKSFKSTSCSFTSRWYFVKHEGLHAMEKKQSPDSCEQLIDDYIFFFKKFMNSQIHTPWNCAQKSFSNSCIFNKKGTWSINLHSLHQRRLMMKLPLNLRANFLKKERMTQKVMGRKFKIGIIIV